jgi:D-alanine-D-alanine ligase
MGGPSSEREISLKSGHAVYDSLKSAGLEVVAIDIRTDKKEENINLIKSQGIDCAFLALHGRFGEDGQIQQLLDNLNIPYTGSGAEASRLAMDKIASRRVLEAGAIIVPRYLVLDKGSYLAGCSLAQGLKLPLVVKPASQGSSIGLSIVDRLDDLDRSIELAFSFDQRVLLEEYILGREMTVGILEGRALPVIEIVPKRRFFDYEAKYQPGMTEYIVPARLFATVARQIQESALAAHRLLGCFACSRVDIILNTQNVPYVLELNSIPGFAPTSLLPKAAKNAGIEFRELCLKLLLLAYEKK